MPAPGTFRPNSAGFRALAVSPEIRRALAEVCEKGKAHAEGISEDFRSDIDEAGHRHYADSFEVRDVTVDWRGEHPGPRAAGRLQNTSGHAAAVEYGYQGRADAPNTSAHRVLGRTLDYLEAGE